MYLYSKIDVLKKVKTTYNLKQREYKTMTLSTLQYLWVLPACYVVFQSVQTTEVYGWRQRDAWAVITGGVPTTIFIIRSNRCGFGALDYARNGRPVVSCLFDIVTMWPFLYFPRPRFSFASCSCVFYSMMCHSPVHTLHRPKAMPLIWSSKLHDWGSGRHHKTR